MQRYLISESSSVDSAEWRIQKQQEKLMSISRLFLASSDIRIQYNVNKSYLRVGGGFQNRILEELADGDGNVATEVQSSSQMDIGALRDECETHRQSFTAIKLNESVKDKIHPKKKERNCLTF